ncbi:MULTISPECIES: MAPEG family protein [Pseudomonadota]|uniref:MAPEG family protein n=2 Tax=Pseudomonadota TaxID=1224 RepID=UPI0032670B68
MSFYVTTLVALALTPIWLVLWMGVTSARPGYETSIGDGGHSVLLLKIRRHGNFIEWVPLTLILMLLAEAQGAGRFWLFAAGGLLVLGRLAHPFGLKETEVHHPLRYVGNGTNFLAAVLLFGTLARLHFGF